MGQVIRIGGDALELDMGGCLALGGQLEGDPDEVSRMRLL